jgi:putative ATP-binding cassette transporter
VPVGRDADFRGPSCPGLSRASTSLVPRIATDSSVDFIAGVTSAFLFAATFIVVLWTIGGALTVTVAGSPVTVPGFLVIAAVVYAAIASGSIMAIGRRFVQISEDKNHDEAEYRYALTRPRRSTRRARTR